MGTQLAQEQSIQRKAAFVSSTEHRDEAATELPRRVHLLGAGGAGVSGIGRILAARGVRVTGHDRAKSAMLEALCELELPIELGESEARLLPDDVELVVRSAAVPEDDPQVLRALDLGIPVQKYADILPRLAPADRLLAVAGTHGKTTTAWMLWHALEGIEELLRGPVAGALIGGICRRLRTNALSGSTGGWFCMEACEYDRTFLKLSPRAAVITNVEEDHLDYYGTLDAIHGAFARFADRIASDGLLVLGRQVPESVELGARASIWRMGREFDVDLLGEDRGAFRFRLRGPGWATRPVALLVPGHFNVENAALVLALAVGITQRVLGLEPSTIANAACNGLERFLGVQRRFDPWGSEGGIDVVHDYAHHPSEVRVTIEAGLRAFPGVPLHVLFQPHQHSRTSHFLEEFADSLRAADRVVVSDVYGARIHMDGQRYAGSKELVLELKKRGVEAVEGGPLSSSVERLVSGLPEKGAAFVLGAGDVELCRDALLSKLALRSPVTS
jgi:UDP-N-acetylmuramate--alanine ligase